MFLVPKMPQLTPYADLSVLPPPQLHAFRHNLSSMPSTSSSPPLVLISPPCQLSKLLALLSKPCCPTPPSPLSPFLSSVFCDVSSRSPVLWCRRFSERVCSFSLHGISHPGVCASRRLLSSQFVWPGLSRDVDLWSRACFRCQQSKVQTHVKSPVSSIPVPGRRFSHVHLDIVSHLPSSQGYC